MRKVPCGRQSATHELSNGPAWGATPEAGPETRILTEQRSRGRALVAPCLGRKAQSGRKRRKTGPDLRSSTIWGRGASRKSEQQSRGNPPQNAGGAARSLKKVRRSALPRLFFVGGRSFVIRIGGKPDFVVVKELSAAPKALAEIFIEPLEPRDLVTFILIRHANDRYRALIIIGNEPRGSSPRRIDYSLPGWSAIFFGGHQPCAERQQFGRRQDAFFPDWGSASVQFRH